MLLENSVLLNRLTKSSIIRVIGVQVGDMPKEAIGPHLMGLKQLIEQKAAINEGVSLNEYTNPGPIENNIYVPIRSNGQGQLSTQQIGGDVDVKSLADLDYFKNKFFGGLRVPKQYFGDTDDSTGFNGGTSLSIISSRYAKMIKRIQNTLIQALTDAINLMLLDKGLNSYINKFELHMLPPTTQEEIDRRDSSDSKIGIINNIMSLLDEIEDSETRLKILKSLLSDVIYNQEVMDTIQEYIEKLEGTIVKETSDNTHKDYSDDMSIDINSPMSRMETREVDDNIDISSNDANIETPEEIGTETISELPTPSSLGMDMTDMNLEI